MVESAQRFPTVEVDESGGPRIPGDDWTPDPKTQMWIIRFSRDGQPREIHLRRHDYTRSMVAARARLIANDTGAPVHFTAGDVSGTYGWRLTDRNHRPVWYVVEPQGMKRARCVESCPNGCGGGGRS